MLRVEGNFDAFSVMQLEPSGAFHSTLFVPFIKENPRNKVMNIYTCAKNLLWVALLTKT